MIAIVLTARPSYAKLQPIMQALYDREEAFSVVACASALLTRYGRVVDRVREDFPRVPIHEVWSTLEGAELITSAKDSGLLLSSLADLFGTLRPDLVVVMADRYETLAATMAARYQNIPVAHVQGGERSGNIDDRVRDANSVFASMHFPSTVLAGCRVYALTGSERIYVHGCPSIDTALAAQADPPVTLDEIGGAGAALDLQRPFLLVLQHSETEHPDAAYAQVTNTLIACERSNLPALVIWPGADPGADGASKAIRMRAVTSPGYPIHTVRGITPRRFLRLLSQCTVLVGNSSAGIRESSALGTPVVNIGDRQNGRERAGNVWDADTEPGAIVEGIAAQRARGSFAPSTLYGDGHSATRIADQLTRWAL